jgi:ABC-type Zn uptake system ZnuABC Zn-binding protein ZnuA
MTTRRPALFLLSAAALSAAALAGCGPSGNWPDKRPRVVVTFPPLASLTRKVLGDHGAVKCLCLRPGNSAEDYEPSREDAAVLRHADLLFSNGLGLDDDAVETLRLNANNPHLQYAALGEAVPENQRLKAPDGAVDPHVWMGLTQAVQMVNAVRDRLKEADPAGAADYDKNAEDCNTELKDLLKEGREVVGKMKEKDRKLVCLHDALRYFAADLGLDVAGTVEVEPSAEPRESRLAKIAELCKKNQARLIVVPQPYPVATEKKLVEELGKRGVGDVEFIVIDPLESADEPAGPDWYKDRMRKNIEALARTLPQ